MKTAVYYRNGIGNFMMATPFLRALHDLDSGSIDLVLVTNPKKPGRSAMMSDFAKLYEGGLIDRVIEPDESKAFDVSPYDRLFAFSHGEDCTVRGSFWRAKAHGQRKPMRDWLDHEVEYYLDAARRLGFRGAAPDMELPHQLPAMEFPFGPYAVICNGSNSAPLWLRKRWQPEQWRQLVWTLNRWLGLQIVLVGGGTETEDHAAIRQGNETYCHDLTGRTSLGETASILKGAQLCLTTDTGTMHLAAAASIPVVALWGPTYRRKNRPWTDAPVEILHKGLDCQPCQYQKRWYDCTENRCMSEITVGDVMAAVRRLEARDALGVAA